VKVVLLNEVVKHPLLKPKFDVGRYFYSIKKFQYQYFLIITNFHDFHVIKVAPNKQM
jgi:hypothetical protein